MLVPVLLLVLVLVLVHLCVAVRVCVSACLLSLACLLAYACLLGSKYLFAIETRNEGRDVWRLLLEKGEFSEALNHCKDDLYKKNLVGWGGATWKGATWKGATWRVMPFWPF